VAQLLLDAGSAVDGAHADGCTALHEAAREGRTEVVRLLLDAGSAIDAVSVIGWTVLHWANYHGHAEVVRMLLAAGADPQAALALAVQRGNHEIAQLLRDAGAAD
jgi:ankyrin repeat protein